MEVIQFDKWVHFGIFIILTFITCWSVKAAESKTLLLIFITAVVYGISVELIQDRFIANRSMDFGDWAADTAGSLGGVWFWKAMYVKK